MTDQQRTHPDAAKWSANMPDEFLLCRDLGHIWQPYRAWLIPNANAYQRILRCGRCHTERAQLLSTSGAILSGGYHYPDGYVAPPGMGRMDRDTRSALRLESTLRRLAEPPDPEETTERTPTHG